MKRAYVAKSQKTKNDPDWDILNTDSNEGDNSEIPSEIATPLQKPHKVVHNVSVYCIVYIWNHLILNFYPSYDIVCLRISSARMN